MAVDPLFGYVPPRSSYQHVMNSGNRNPVVGSENAKNLAVGAPTANLAYDLFSQSGPRVPGPSRGSSFPSQGRVPVVVRHGSFSQVVGVDTGRVIARVKTARHGELTMREKVGHPMRLHRFSKKLQVTVPLPVTRRLPGPTRIRATRGVNFRPKPGNCFWGNMVGHGELQSLCRAPGRTHSDAGVPLAQFYQKPHNHDNFSVPQMGAM